MPYASKVELRAHHSAYTLRRYREDPAYRAKHSARRALNHAIRFGKVARGACDGCGATDGIQGHHEDYSRPLDVRWLCRPCHDREHGHFFRPQGRPIPSEGLLERYARSGLAPLARELKVSRPRLRAELVRLGASIRPTGVKVR